MHALRKNKTWTLVDRVDGMNVVKNKWVFKIKYKPDGKTIDRYRARLVAKGYSQQEGIDYKETFSPVARYDTIRFLFSLVPALDLKVTQFDRKTAFLHGELEEDVFMEQPDGFDEDGGWQVCKLQKALYGLKQSPRQWTANLSGILAQYGFSPLQADTCVFQNKAEGLLVCLYVDSSFGSMKTARTG